MSSEEVRKIEEEMARQLVLLGRGFVTEEEMAEAGWLKMQKARFPLVDIWEYAIGFRDDAEWFAFDVNGRRWKAGDVDERSASVARCPESDVRAIQWRKLEEAAVAGGVDRLLAAYFAGVPLCDVRADFVERSAEYLREFA